MTVGIYKLIFKCATPNLYIGQSQNIETRLSNHRSTLKHAKASSKMLDAYVRSNYEPPILELVEETTLSELDTRELYYIELYDSINTGLNTTDKVVNLGRGEDNFNAKYSNEEILEAFLYIIKNIDTKSNKELSTNTGLSLGTVLGILHGSIHSWIYDIYPEEYDTLVFRDKKRTSSAKKLGISYPPIVSPYGVVYVVDNVQQFARDHDLNNSSLHQVLTGKRKSCAKWKLAA